MKKESDQELLKVAVDWVKEAQRLYGTDLGGRYTLSSKNDKYQDKISGALNILCTLGSVGGDPVRATCIQLEHILWNWVFSVCRNTDELDNLRQAIHEKGVDDFDDPKWEIIEEISDNKFTLFPAEQDAMIRGFLFDIIGFYKIIKRVKVGEI